MRTLHLFLSICLLLTLKEAFAAPLKIVHIGDSQSIGSFGPELNRLLKTIPEAQVSTFASGGSKPLHWVNGEATDWDYYEFRYNQKKPIKEKKWPTPLIKDLLKLGPDEAQTQLMIVQLGANILTYPDEYILEWIAKTLAEIKKVKASCVWIGPSQRRTHAELMPHFYEVLDKGLKNTGCQMIDSRNYTSYPRIMGDGIHFNFLGGKKIAHKWALGSFNEIEIFLKATGLRN